MKTAIHRSSNQSGFTLIEIMLVVAIIAMLAAIGIPSYQRARKRAQAADTLNDLRIVDSALCQWAVEFQKAGGTAATFDDIRPYLKEGSNVAVSGRDVLGNEFGPNFTVDTAPDVPAATFSALQEVAPAEFWSPYRTP